MQKENWRGVVAGLCLSLTALLTAIGSASADTFTISGNQILQNGVAKSYRGSNSLHIFGGDSAGMASWNMDIVRVFIGNMQNTPITGGAVFADGSWFHSIDEVVTANRANGKITIICPFGWNASLPLFTGLNPRAQTYYNAYKTKMRDWANYAKTQPDVWIEVWNEPYAWNNSNGYTDALWLADMKDMVDNIRSTGATNIILVPGNRQGQGEEAIIAQGKNLLSGRSNILFDLHAYERWLTGSGEPATDATSVENRLKALKNKNFAVLFGELGPMNAGALMNPSVFLKVARQQDISVLGWVWKQDGNDQDALQDALNNPNNNNNNNWGTTFLNFSTGLRGISASSTSTTSLPGYMADNDTATVWSTAVTQRNGQSIILGLGTGRNWNHIRMDMGASPQNYPRTYTLYVSDDRVTWTQKATGSGTAFVTDIWPGPQWSKYVKIIQTGTATVPWTIAELEVRQD